MFLFFRSEFLKTYNKAFYFVLGLSKQSTSSPPISFKLVLDQRLMSLPKLFWNL